MYVSKAYQKKNVQEKINRYNNLPIYVQNCISFEDLDDFEESIKKNTWYSRQLYRLDCLPYTLGCNLVKKWLSNLDIYPISNEQNDVDLLAIYVACKLSVCLPDLERKSVLKKLQLIKDKYFRYSG